MLLRFSLCCMENVSEMEEIKMLKKRHLEQSVISLRSTIVFLSIIIVSLTRFTKTIWF